jgi:hypothetical protein
VLCCHDAAVVWAWLMDQFGLPETLRITPAAFRAQSPRVPQPYILNLHAVYHFITILLHRPWYSRPKADETATTEDTSVTRCNKAA